MGSAPSRSFPEPSLVRSCDNLFSRQEHEQQARHMLSRLHIIPPLQRRRTRSVGFNEENGTFWVYWRPGHGQENGRQQARGGLNVDAQPPQDDDEGKSKPN